MDIRWECGISSQPAVAGFELRHLVDRGLSGVRLIISDACRGLETIAPLSDDPIVKLPPVAGA